MPDWMSCTRNVKTLLIVDDSRALRNQVRGILEEAGFAVLEAGNGAEGLARLAEQRAISLVLLDVNMPVMGGLEMLRCLAVQAGMPQVPVLMLTTEGDPESISRAASAGAKGWLIKPVAPSLLVAAVTKVCG